MRLQQPNVRGRSSQTRSVRRQLGFVCSQPAYLVVQVYEHLRVGQLRQESADLHVGKRDAELGGRSLKPEVGLQGSRESEQRSRLKSREKDLRP